MKKKIHLILHSILLCCLFGAKALATTPEGQFSFLSLESPAAQNNLQANDEIKFEEIEKHVVAFNSPFHYNLNKDTRWEIIHTETGQTFKSGSGSIQNMIFETPGEYLIQVVELLAHSSDSCDHTHFPEKILLEVSPYQLVFDFSTVKSSRNIMGNQSLNGITLTVDVLFTSYHGTPVAYAQNFTSSGVRTSLAGKLKNGEAILQQGINTLEFQLEGQVSSGTYINIDFMDINGQIQSYSLINKIK